MKSVLKTVLFEIDFASVCLLMKNMIVFPV